MNNNDTYSSNTVPGEYPVEKKSHQLVWSAGLRSRLFKTAGDLSDLEVVQEQELEEVILLGQLNRRQWSTILKNEARGELLEVAKSGNWQDVTVFLQSIGTSNTYSPLSLGTCAKKVSSVEVIRGTSYCWGLVTESQ